MYGTVSEICIALLKQHESNKKIAVITWTPEDVREAGAEYTLPTTMCLTCSASSVKRAVPACGGTG